LGIETRFADPRKPETFAALLTERPREARRHGAVPRLYRQVHNSANAAFLVIQVNLSAARTISGPPPWPLALCA